MTHLFRLLCLLPVLASLLAAEPARLRPVTVYVVRHAEKNFEINPQDPPLSVAGQLRAKALAEVLAKKPVVAVYATNTVRTRATAEAVAKAAEVEIQPYTPTAKGLAELAATIRQTTPGRAVLVVGHSNTVLETLEALGAARPVKAIGDDEYSYLFEVKLPTDGDPPTVTVRRYGAVKP